MKTIKSEQVSLKEWKEMPSGTKAARVKTYNDDGRLVDVIYVVYSEKDDDFYSELKDAKSVGPGYWTDTCGVLKK